MYSKAILLAALVAFAEARFGQEQGNGAIAAISASSGGKSGDAATLGGAAISTLLGAANPCDKLTKADEIVATLGDGGVEAAKGLVAAEQNFNPSATDKPTFCSDPTLPTTEALRGIVPLIDPAVTGSDVENAASKASLTTPLDATGKSIADLATAAGFTNFATKDASGAAGAAGSGAVASGAAKASGGATKASASASAPVASAAAGNNTAVVDQGACGPAAVATTLATVTKSKAATATKAGNNNNANAGNAVKASASTSSAATKATASAGTGASTGNAGALDFGTCDPQIKFEGGLGGRKATEFTFQSVDPVISAAQQEALNPNIITNRICDVLGNNGGCGASAEAVTACLDAKAQILALGTKDQTTADAWNALLG